MFINGRLAILKHFKKKERFYQNELAIMCGHLTRNYRLLISAKLKGRPPCVDFPYKLNKP